MKSADTLSTRTIPRTSGPKPKSRAALCKDKPAGPKEPAVRVDPETVMSMGRMWRMASGYSVAYVTSADLACELLQTNRRRLDDSAMAFYTNRKGRVFAWQIAFRTDRWDEIARRLG